MPTFSVIVPVHKVRAYVRECVDSILTQSYRDLEVLAVDDCSPDGSGDILEEYAAADHRVRVVHMERNVGLGAARNAGLDVATGDYLLFVDGDDSMTPGSLEAIASRLAETDRPDVLIYDYARTYWDGRVIRNQLCKLLSAPGPDVFAIDQRPELLRLLMIVWNKAYRREFVERHSFRFPVGYYEDLPWTYPTLLAAERIATLDRVCIFYRQRRHGNILHSQDRRHFDVFDQYDRVFRFVDAHPELACWRAFLVGRMVNHCWVVLTCDRRVPGDAQREFFERLAAHYRSIAPPGFTPPSDHTGRRMRVVACGDYRAFVAVRAAAKARSRARATVGTVQRRTKRHVLRMKQAGIAAYYRAALHQPVDENLAVFAAYWYRGYSGNPAAIYEEMNRLAPRIRGVWIVQPKYAERMPPGVDYVLAGGFEYYRLMARAKYFVNNVNFPDDIVKRPGTLHLQTQHGTPLKKMGIDLKQLPVAAHGMDFQALMRRCDRWDYLLAANRFSAEVWERAYPSGYVTLETGYPRNDRLVGAQPDEVAAVRAALGIAEGTNVLLYLPTFRDWERDQFAAPVDLADLGRRLGKEWVVLVRAHYLHCADEQLRTLEDVGLLRDVSHHPVVEDLLLAADVLVTDYSSVMFDYANLDRPIVIHASDWDVYQRVRGVNFDLMALPPGVVTTTQDELVDALLSGRYRDEAGARARQRFREVFCDCDDGRAAERVVRYIFLGEPLLGRRGTSGTGAEQRGPHNDDAAGTTDINETSPVAAPMPTSGASDSPGEPTDEGIAD